MNKQQQLIEKLKVKFEPSFLQVENESHMHSSGRGAESHFKVVIVADAFVGLRKVPRHQLIYQLLAEDLANGIHALALHVYSPEEWLALGENAPKSPNCLGHGQ